MCYVRFVFFKQKTAYEMRISDWSSDVCSSDLVGGHNLLSVDLPRLGFSRTEILAMARERKILDGWVMAPMIDQPASFTDVKRPDSVVWINGKDGRPDMD